MDDKNDEVLLTLDSVSKGFQTRGGRFSILENVDFSVRAGETIAVIGPSGIGKSTLLQIMGTLDSPDTGRLMFRDQDLMRMEETARARFRNTNIGFVFQFHHLLQGFTALENVMMPGLINNGSKKSTAMVSTAILERVGLKHRLFHRAEDLSGGEQQRVALARALVMKPELLLADEPTGNLDRENSADVHRLITELNQELNMTVVVVTHNDALADLMERKVTIRDCSIIAAD
ncbi:MAG: ABC transporter ATP-binding protein [Pseudomonadota bacterium]